MAPASISIRAPTRPIRTDATCRPITTSGSLPLASTDAERKPADSIRRYGNEISFLIFLEVNAAFCRMMGYPPEELVRLRVRDVTHPDDRSSSIRRRKKQLTAPEEAKRIEKRYVRADDSVVWVAVSSTLVGMGVPSK